jgi:hypothetical protein
MYLLSGKHRLTFKLRNWQGGKILPLMAVLITSSGMGAAQQQKITCEVKYENHNQISTDALTIRNLRGQVTNELSEPISQACLGVYTETERKLIASTTSDENGNYTFGNIQPGQYRLVVFSPGYCTANARINVEATDLSSLKHRLVYVHMRIRALHDCSYANHTRPRIENGR